MSVWVPLVLYMALGRNPKSYLEVQLVSVLLTRGGGVSAIKLLDILVINDVNAIQGQNDWIVK